MAPLVNVLLDSFPGLSLPPTVCFALRSSSTTAELLAVISDLLPPTLPSSVRLTVTSTANRSIYPSHSVTVADLVSASSSSSSSSSPSQSSCLDHGAPLLLPLRLSAPLVGGKGGFGSQLRAAGGRMSSRKKKANAELATGSARNLDGRRLRTITEAKNLATYLATKPEMDRKEKEERRKKWEQIIALAEQREADMRAGKGADGHRKGLSEEWVVEKEEVGENVRNAVKVAMRGGLERENGAGPPETERDGESSGSGGSAGDGPSDNESDADEVMELDQDDMSRLRVEAEAGDADAIWVLRNRLKIPSHLLPKARPVVRRFAGFDDDDVSSSDDEGGEEPEGQAEHPGPGPSTAS